MGENKDEKKVDAVEKPKVDAGAAVAEKKAAPAAEGGEKKKEGGEKKKEGGKPKSSKLEQLASDLVIGGSIGAVAKTVMVRCDRRRWRRACDLFVCELHCNEMRYGDVCEPSAATRHFFFSFFAFFFVCVFFFRSFFRSLLFRCESYTKN